MLKRKIESVLLDWLNDENRNPLILKGCRQCGKTFSVLRFARDGKMDSKWHGSGQKSKI